MKPRWLIAAAPVAISGLIYAFVQSFVMSGSAADPIYTAVRLVAFTASVVGCGVAAAQFDRGDYMRWAWTAMGLCGVLLLVTLVFFGKVIHLAGNVFSPESGKIVNGVLVGLANLCTVVGQLLVARTWRATGMDFQVSRAVKVGAVLGSLVLALVIAGGSTWNHLHLVLSGHLENLTLLFSAVGDIISLVVLAPILLTALSLRGGSLSWPWTMLVVGTIGWVLYDGAATVSGWMHLDPSHVRPLMESFRVWACVAYLSAGLLQRSARLEAVAPAMPALG